MMNLHKILDDLKHDGCRITKIRQGILVLLTKSQQPLSSLNIQNHLSKKNINVNKTTVYRELEFLKKKLLILELKFDDKINRYEINSIHHHHIVCIKCKVAKCIELTENLEQQEKLIEKNNKFKIISHSLEFYGLCHNCNTLAK